MSKIRFLLICASGLITLGDSSPKKRKMLFVEPSRYDNRLGIRVAGDSLIQLYENEHKMMYREKDGTSDATKYTEWPHKLGDENLTEYCEKYLKAIIPRRHIRNMFGVAGIGRMLYLHERDGVQYCSIGIIKCEVPVSNSMKGGKTYFMTEAPEKGCVYSMMHTTRGASPLKIVSKICGFESDDIFEYQPKERVKIHKRTGIPISSRDLIAEYEYKHHEMYKKDDVSTFTEKYRTWPLIQNKINLTDFCAKYLNAVVPNRVQQKNIFGEKDSLVLKYTQHNWVLLEIGIIKCRVQPSEGMKTKTYYYYITESPNPDCVYTLLRQTQALVCMIVNRICDMKFNVDTKDLENKSDSHIVGNTDIYFPPNDGTENLEMKPDMKTLELLPQN